MKRTLRTAAVVSALSLTLAAGVALASGAKEEKAPKPEDVFVQMDTDKDGKVTKEEFVAVYEDKVVAEREFVAYDKDGNGYLVKEEYTVKVKPLKGAK